MIRHFFLLIAFAVTFSAQIAIAQTENEYSDALKAQLRRCWVIPNAQAKDVDKMTVELLVDIGRDRIAKRVEIIDRQGQMSNPVYRALAESASRAVRSSGCRPLILPEEKYEDWRNLRIRFTPEDVQRAAR